MGQIITFYSYKGGVGRTTALANVGVLLSRWGYKTLVVDWDLEAPGLEFFYKEYLDIRTVNSKSGIVDLLSAHSRSRSKPGNLLKWSDLVIDIQLPHEAEPLHMLTAGSIADGYFTKLRNFDVEDFYRNEDGGLFIEQLRGEWREAFDFVLIDSRTGITDIGGICTAQMPDVLVLFFTASDQAFQGILDVASKAQAARQKFPVDRLKLLCVPIPSKFDSDKEFRLSQEYLSDFALQVSNLYADWLPRGVSAKSFLESTKIPYIPYFSFGAKLAVIEQGTTDPAGLGYAYETLAAMIANNLESTDQLVSDRSQFVRKVAKTEEYGRPVFRGIKAPFGSSDRDFQATVEQIIAGESSGQFNVLVEKLRDRTVAVWRGQLGSGERINNEAVRTLKESEFLSAMRALTLLGLAVIKYGASVEWFDKICDVLIDVFEVNSELRKALPSQQQDLKPGTLDAHDTHTVPALESLLSANLLASYDLSKNKNVKYFSKLFPRCVKYAADPYDQPFSIFFLFWPYFYWAPNIFIEALVAERYGNGSIAEDFFSNQESVKISMLQANCLLEWHSFISMKGANEGPAGEPETVRFFQDKYPSVRTDFHPSFVHEPPQLIAPLIVRMWDLLSRKSETFLSLDPTLDSVISGIDLERRKEMLGRFLVSVRKQHQEYMFQQSRFPFSFNWPPEIQAVVNGISNEK